MFKTTTNYTVTTDTFMSDIFRDGLPVNAFIHKGRCAIRGTSIELEKKTRTTLIIVPNISIILGKYTSERISDRPDYIVYGNIGDSEISSILNDDKVGIKIMSTPEGMKRIMRLASKSQAEHIKANWFLLLDESHTFISELYRINILAPFEFFWDFNNKSIISATPYFFSDPRFKSLDYHEIKFTEKLGKVTLVNAVSVTATLEYLIANRNEFPGNIHIFYNSVTEIKRAVLQSELEECNIFCADDKDSQNMQKLGDLQKHFIAEPRKGLYKKINFYTCKYFEGWDLYDKGATMVLVTDCHKEHTKVGVASKGKQAIGRLRNEPFQIIHISNHEHKDTKISLEQYKAGYTSDALRIIKSNNEHILNAEFDKFKGDNRAEKFADVDQKTKLATLNLYKLDQQINESASNEIYKSIKFIKEDWEAAYYDVEVQYSDLKLVSKTEQERKSAAKILEEDYKELKLLQSQTSGSLMFTFGKGKTELIKESNPLAYQAFLLMNDQEMSDRKYNVKKVQREVIIRENGSAEIKFLKLCKGAFKKDTFYTNAHITSKLNEFYKKLGIKDPKTSEIKKAHPSDLGSEGRFKLKHVRRTVKGVRQSGIIIEAYSLDVNVLE
ncbi:MAG: hypothetical protein Q8S11_02895 [Daejeonella sp.]|uniref:hypothetical protein n=1 Tax=Daejeonella sp. TaxID=2805397 RepID=UPI0027353D0C|nr:hypothetical protein [Daejeonella sp.]MDP3467254.1 hypothetical protein [Daejeonella sp.]